MAGICLAAEKSMVDKTRRCCMDWRRADAHVYLDNVEDRRKENIQVCHSCNLNRDVWFFFFLKA